MLIPFHLVSVCSVWSGSALSTYVFIYSHALNFYLIIRKKLQISGHPVWNFPACACRVAEKTSNSWELLALDGAAWHRGVAGSTHPKPGEAVLGPVCWAPLPLWGWEVPGALGKREGTRIRHSERELVSSGVEEAVGKGVGITSAGVSICICIYWNICSIENLVRSNRVSLNCRKITHCSNLPC